MSYCQPGQPSTVNYSFSDGSKSKVEIPNSPINVSTVSGALNTYNYNDPNLPGNRSASGDYYEIINNIGCIGGKAVNIFANGVLQTTSCFLQGSMAVENAIGKCKLIVSDANNNQLFTASGECPIKFTVSCADECPPGTCKCPSPGYPGYCCNDCAITAAKIQAITNALRAKNNGK